MDHVQLKDVGPWLGGEKEPGLQIERIERRHLPANRRAQTIGDDHVVVGIEPLIGQVHWIVAIGRPSKGALVAYPDREGYGLLGSTLGGCIHTQPGYAVARADPKVLPLPRGRSLLGEPHGIAGEHIKLQRIEAWDSGRPDGHSRDGDCLTRRDRTRQAGQCPRNDRPIWIVPAVAHTNGTRARFFPGPLPFIAHRYVKLTFCTKWHARRRSDLQPGDHVLVGGRRQDNLVSIVHRPSKVFLDTRLVFDGPAHLAGIIGIANDPPEQDQRLNRLVGRILIPAIDLVVRVLHPAGVFVAPSLILISLGDIDGTVAQILGNGGHEIAIGIEMVVVVLERWVHGVCAENKVGVLTMGIRMQGYAIHSIAQEGQDVGKVPDPVSFRVARVLGLDVPRTDGPHEDLIAFVPGAPADLLPAFEVAGSIEVGCDYLTARPPRAFIGQVHLIADDPDVAAGTRCGKVAAATGKAVVLVRIGNGARCPVTMVETDDHTQPLVAQVGVVAATAIVGIGTDGFSDQYPTASLLAGHQVLTAAIVHAKNVGWVDDGHRNPPRVTRETS